ncbi:hypothetical protein [Actinoplanes sp. HUAS TT8]|uniref:hypothetical protein n=1 Tax=Actinoplanes sp. HUAS TT8 TaxID=3447453 RepID=UPI003F522BFF
MRFFSNEAKDNVEDQDVRTDAVPQQRPGSPWDDRPGANAEPAAFGTPAPEDTYRSTDADDRTDEDRDRVAEDRTVTPADGVTEDDERARSNDDTVAWPAGETPAAHDADRDPDVDVPLDDHRDTDGDTPENRDAFGDPDALDERDRIDERETAEDVHVPVHRAAEDDEAEVAEVTEDRGTFDDPQVVDVEKDDVKDEPFEAAPVVAEPVDASAETEPVDASTEAEPVVAEPVDAPAEVEAEPVVAVAAVPEPATTAAVSGPAPFFPESDTQPLRDRWRDIQLRFVDDPKATTAEAATLVDETIEKLTAALRDHKGSLAGGGDDTEALRVELRSYRDILDRLLGL